MGQVDRETPEDVASMVKRGAEIMVAEVMEEEDTEEDIPDAEAVSEEEEACREDKVDQLVSQELDMVRKGSIGVDITFDWHIVRDKPRG